MKKHNLIFAAIATMTLITLACNALVPAPARPQGSQPGPQPEQPNPGQPPESGQSSGPQQSNPGQPGGQGQQPGGQGPASSEPVQIDRTITIPANGGSAEITFDISNGQWTHIVLTAGNPSMQPYGSMQYPDGMSVDCPPLTTTTNGMNQADILLTDPGHYTLTLFDGSNQGGPVSVKMVGSQ